MTKLGFVIDHRKCIGCHACTVACKAENQVSLGVFCTWVKYVEKGEFPNTRRYFMVERCQHCENAPCVKICPTGTLFKRADGIVDFGSDRCIGCKSCIVACPYNAPHIDPVTHTVAKCNYCAHRISRGLLPACTITCPTGAIVAGDLDDSSGEIAHLLAREQVQVRRPDQGTRPQVFYLGADVAAITPGVAMQPTSYLWSELGPRGMDLELKGSPWPISRNGDGVDYAKVSVTPPSGRTETSPNGNGIPRRNASTSSYAEALRAMPEQRGITPNAITVYDVPHARPWGRKVSTCLWTKSIAAGIGVVAGPLLIGAGVSPGLSLGAPLMAGLFAVLTALLLVSDLERPERVWRMFLAPNPRSWLALGGYVLTAYGATVWLLFLTTLLGLSQVSLGLLWPMTILGLATAGYSAFLFGQAEGRDFWQSPLVFWHLLVAAVSAGAASLLLLAPVADPGNVPLLSILNGVLLIGVVVGLAITLTELYAGHPNKDVAMAAAILKRGALAKRFWLGYVVAGVILPSLVLLGIVVVALPLGFATLASALALAGLWVYEDLWVRAGQSVAMS